MSHRSVYWSSVLCVCVGAYFAFHAVRNALPLGVFRGSFPSFLVPVAMFSIVELIPGIRFYSRRLKALTFCVVVGVGAFWLEVIVPILFPRSVGDLWDAAAMGGGFLAYWMIDTWAVPQENTK